MAVIGIELRSDDISPAGSGNSISVAIKGIRRNVSLEAAEPAIQATVETVSIPLGGEYHHAISEANVTNEDVGSGNNMLMLLVDVTENAGNHTNFTMCLLLEARP